MTSESCAMMFFAGKNPCQCVSHYFRCRGHFLLHRTARGTAARVVRTQIFLSVWEHDYLQYSWIVFSHCSTVTAVSRVSVDKFLVSLGPVQTSCFCRAELNSGIKFEKSTVEARRLNQTFELSSAKQLSSTSSAVLHDSGTAVIQTSCLCRAKLNS